jgi:hypothetical protein
MNSFITSLIRTWTPMVVGAIVAWLVSKGYAVNPEQSDALGVVLTGAFSAAYYLIVRFLEAKFPQAGWLLGVPAKPSYGLKR